VKAYMMVVVRDVHGREKTAEVDPDKVDVRLSGGGHFLLDVSDGFNPWGGGW